MVEFRYGTTVISVPRQAGRVELLPVMRLIGAEAVYSPAAGTYAVALGEDLVQFTLERQTVLAKGVLMEAGESPIPSPGGVAASVDFLERALLAPFGFHLEPSAGGFLVARGAKFTEPVTVRPASADFPGTTTVLLGLSRPARAQVTTAADGRVVVRFADAQPQLDPTVPLRSPRVRGVDMAPLELRLALADEVGLLSWHALDNPPRLVLELGRVRSAPEPEAAPPDRRPEQAPIVVDPGHGGDDTGAMAGGLMEKDVVLGIARRLRAALEAHGEAVRLTREGDENRALTDRAALANRVEARVFISLHANASTFASVRGAETYYMSLDQGATDAAAAATAQVENLVESGAEGEQSPLDLILWDLAQADVLNESARLALAVQLRLNERLGLNDRGVKQAPFVVLTGATMPAILVEVGFLSNAEEQQRLLDPAHQQQLAEAIAVGVLEFLGGR
jgi:N-acetylmuramoyl-L-alanine amidase